jgi:hypothetical protein
MSLRPANAALKDRSEDSALARIPVQRKKSPESLLYVGARDLMPYTVILVEVRLIMGDKHLRPQFQRRFYEATFEAQ